jgi:hypothetical protein
VLVMMTMMIGPPKRTALNGRTRPKREEELAETGRAVGFVRKVPVKNPGDRKHPEKIKRHRRPNRKPAPPHPNHPEATDMKNDERNTADEIDPVRLGPDDLGCFD